MNGRSAICSHRILLTGKPRFISQYIEVLDELNMGRPIAYFSLAETDRQNHRQNPTQLIDLNYGG